MITFYDLPVNLPIKCGSPNSWKARYCLNYKGVPYQTKWLEYAEIEPLFKEMGMPPTSTKPDGSPYYTIPAIYDDATGAKVSDSIKIAAYLDGTYPSGKPDIIPPGTEVLQHAFLDAFMDTLFPLWPLILPDIPGKLSPISSNYFKTVRAQQFGVNDLEDMRPKGEEALALSLEKVETAFGKVYGWMKVVENKPFIGGDTPIFADFIVGATLISLKLTWGEDSVQWKTLSKWHGGKWAKIVDQLKEYQAVD